MGSTLQQKLIKLLIRPLANYALKNSISIREFIEASKIAFTESAADEIRQTGTRLNISQIAVMTGLPRQDVSRILDSKVMAVSQSQGILARVIGFWEQDKRFQLSSGKPKPLECEGDDSEFFKLVSSVSKHVGPKAVLAELERKEMVKRQGDTVRLMKGGEIYGEDLEKGFSLISRDIGTLISSAEENLKRIDETGNAHVRTEYDNIYCEDLPEIRKWIVLEVKKLHKRFRAYLARYDADLEPRTTNDKAGAKVVVTTFGHVVE